MKTIHEVFFKKQLYIVILVSIVILSVLTVTFLYMKPHKNIDNSCQQKYQLRDNNTIYIPSFIPDTLNPLFTENYLNSQMLNLIFEPLFKCNSKLEATPWLASEYNIVNNGMKYIIKLKNNVYFHDGTLLKVSDVVYTLNSVKNNRFTSLYTENLRNVGSIVESGDNIEIQLQKPTPNFLNLLNIPIIKTSTQIIKDKFEPIGTGPYKFNSQENDRISLISNNNWHTGKTIAIENIIVRLVNDTDVPRFLYDTDNIDIITVDSDLISKYSSDKKNNKVIVFDTNKLCFIKFSKTLDLNFRESVCHAIDRDKISKEIKLSNCNLTDTFMNPAWGLYDRMADGFEFDKTQGKNKLKESRNSSKKVEILVNSENISRTRIAHFIVSELIEIGINAFVKSVNFSEYVSLINSGNYDMYIGEVNLSPDIDVKSLCSTIGTTVQNDRATYQDLDFSDKDDLFNYYTSIQKHINNEVMFLPLFYNKNAISLKNTLSNNLTPSLFNIYEGIENVTRLLD